MAVCRVRFLLSGGGNEIAGTEFAMLLNHTNSTLPPLNAAIVDAVVNQRLRFAMASMIATVTRLSTRYFNRPAPPDDPQKYQWGGQPARNGRTLSADVGRIDRDWYWIELRVSTDPGAKMLKGPVRFHLHDSFPDSVRTVRARDGVARLRVVAYGAFTVGVEADEGKTQLELDLAELPKVPKAFRES